MNFLIGILAFLSVVFNTLFWCILLLVLAVLKLLIPIERCKIFFTKWIIYIGECWILCNGIWIKILHKPTWKVTGFESLNKDCWYIATSNHQSWADIFVLQGITNRKIPMLKFFMKEVLIWVPVIGLAWWALDMPFLRRYSKETLKKNPELRGKDISEMQTSFKRFSRYPVSIFSFAEGTRYTNSKHSLQESPFKNLLRPKVGGIGLALSTIPCIDKFIDFTISYKSSERTLWNFLCGKMSDVDINVRIIDIPKNFLDKDYINDPLFREELKDWMNKLWEQKESLIK